MNTPISKTIPLVAGIATIVNFSISLFPFLSNPPTWFTTFKQVRPEFKLVILLLLTYLSALCISRLLVLLHQTQLLPSFKMALYAILSTIYAWIVFFNVEIINLNYVVLFMILILVSYYFFKNRLDANFKKLGYEEVENPLSEENDPTHLPADLGLIVHLSFVFVAVLYVNLEYIF